jgi:A118 family predicted phage portal protein
MHLEDFLKLNYGYDRTISDNWKKYTELWKSWYCGKVKRFHDYTIYNGKRRVKMERLSMQMAKKCCEDWADLLFNERCRVSVSDSGSQDALLRVLDANDFWTLVNNGIESSGASGTGAFVVSVENMTLNEDTNVIDVTEASTKIRYVDVDGIYPLTWDGRRVTECAFAAKTSLKGKNYVYLSVHLLENGKYVIYNHAFEDTNGSLKEVDSDVLSRFDTQSAVKWFSIISPAGVNQIYPSSPWGLPYFANAIDTLKAIDTAYDSLNNEIQLGRKRIFARQDLFNISENGVDPVFDCDDISVYMLPKGATANDLIQPENSELRVDQIKQDIELNLMIFCSLVGFGENHFKQSTQTEQTATAVISENSAMFRRKKKHETALESTLKDLITAVAYAETSFGQSDINVDGLIIQFDDSVVEDRSVLTERALREIQAGVLSPIEYRMAVKGESEEVAKQKIKEIESRYPTTEQLVGDA